MTGNRKKILAIIITITFLFVGYRVFIAVSNGSGGKNSSVIESIPVLTTVAETREIERKITMSGDSYPTVGTEIFSKISGRLEDVKVGIGDIVSKGAVLAVVEQAENDLKVREAEATYNVALADLERTKGTLDKEKAEYLRAESLYNDKLISSQDFEKEKEQYLSAEASLNFTEAKVDEQKTKLDIAKKNLNDCWIRTPIAGVVTRSNVDLGTMVYASSGGGNSGGSKALFVIENLKRIKILVKVPANYAHELKVGQDSEVIVPSLDNKQFLGKVTRVSPSFDQDTRSSVAIVQIDNEDMQLMSGLFVKVQVYTEKIKNAVMIPRDAVFKKDRKDYVFVMNDGTASLREIEIGASVGDMIQALKGVNKGEAVITSNRSRIYDGAKIKEGLS